MSPKPGFSPTYHSYHLPNKMDHNGVGVRTPLFRSKNHKPCPLVLMPIVEPDFRTASPLLCWASPYFVMSLGLQWLTLSIDAFLELGKMTIETSVSIKGLMF